ncbi:hypothetical protein Q9L58_010419 [Maublancomyces gigas]|uniref:HNH nuclease domain-containing protein n=1 Tax=Discina gigas TaxID=1032678 RepID=A0ABR3G4L6_9PEZI
MSLPIATLASSTNISSATRNRVIASTGSLCWLCGVPGRHVAHVVPRSDQLIFNDLHASNLLTFPNLHSYRNLLYLCPNCHTGYDDRVPEWAFLPTDMDPFLAAEQAYHDLRRACFPIPIARPDPPNTGLYTRYQIRRGMVLRRTFRERPTEEWWGSSVAAITRSASALCGIKRLSVTECGIPDAVAMKVQRLLLLYGAPDPEFMCIIRVPRADDNDDNGNTGDGDMLDPKEKADSRPPPPPLAGPSHPPARPQTRPPTRRSARTGKPPRRQRHDRNHITPSLTESQPSSCHGHGKSTKGLVEDEWFYGPKSTANDVSFWFKKAGGRMA